MEWALVKRKVNSSWGRDPREEGACGLVEDGAHLAAVRGEGPMIRLFTAGVSVSIGVLITAVEPSMSFGAGAVPRDMVPGGLCSRVGGRHVAGL